MHRPYQQCSTPGLDYGNNRQVNVVSNDYSTSISGKDKRLCLQNSQLIGPGESKIEYVRCHFKDISNNGYIYDIAKDYKLLYNNVTK